MRFGYEGLEVWNRAVDFSVKVIELVGFQNQMFRP